MVRTQTPVKSNPAGVAQQHSMSTHHASRRRTRIAHFGLHFVEMLAAMGVGMAIGMPVYRAIAGVSSTAQAYRLYPASSVSAMALTMALPMVGWMLLRGHGWRNSAEMAAAMIVPALPFIILGGLNVISGTACRAYMPLSIAAMVGLMVYRWDVYSMPMRGLWRRHLRH